MVIALILLGCHYSGLAVRVDDLFKITVTHTSIFHFHTDNNKQVLLSDCNETVNVLESEWKQRLQRVVRKCAKALKKI
jgi:hypothetical protein